MNKHIGFGKSPPTGNQWIQMIHWGFVVLMLLSVGLVQMGSRIQEMSTNQSMIVGALPDFSLRASMTDPDMGGFLWDIHMITDQLVQQDYLFPAVADNIGEVFGYLLSPSRASRPLAKRYPAHWSLLTGIAQFEDDVRELLGEKGPQTYLIILQNTAEKRPNGGFFGSFGLLTLDRGKVSSFEIIDSYLPQHHQPGTYITGPEWLQNFLPEREIYFVGANKVGFTYHDGANILNLYEKSYPGVQIKGVVFISTDMFVDLLPGFQKQLREWQFVNASIDLIRGEDRRGKKEIYLRSSQEFFAQHQEMLIASLVKHLPELLEQRYINVYLEDISGKLHGWLRRAKLTTRFEEDHLYFWDSNISFNKSDQFVEKVIQIKDDDGKTLIETNEEIVSIATLPTGTYEVNIYYQLHVPQAYLAFIANLEDHYGIELETRERHILMVDPEWATRGLVYYPDRANISAVTGDIYHQELFDTPFAQALYYKSKIVNNNDVNIVSFSINVP